MEIEIGLHITIKLQGLNLEASQATVPFLRLDTSQIEWFLLFLIGFVPNSLLIELKHFAYCLTLVYSYYIYFPVLNLFWLLLHKLIPP